MHTGSPRAGSRRSSRMLSSLVDSPAAHPAALPRRGPMIPGPGSVLLLVGRSTGARLLGALVAVGEPDSEADS